MIDGVFKALTEAAVKGEGGRDPGLWQVQGPGQAGPHRPQSRRRARPIEIAASRKVAFTPAKQLKDAVNG
jgi:DNA-binding protein HU-beta